MPKRVYRGTWKASGLRLLQNFEYNLLHWVNGEGASETLEQDRDGDVQAFRDFLGGRPHYLIAQSCVLEDEIGSVEPLQTPELA